MQFIKIRKRSLIIATSFLVVFCLLVTVGSAIFLTNRPVSKDKLNTFASCSDIADWIKTAQGVSPGLPLPVDLGSGIERQDNTSGSAASDGDFSSTNVQVQGVDEADVVKTDGNYIFASVGTHVSISEVIATGTKEVAVIELDYAPSNLFISGKKLIIIGANSPVYETTGVGTRDLIYRPDFKQTTTLSVYDVSQTAKPVLTLNTVYDGNLSSARLIDGTIYLASEVSNYYVYLLNANAASVENLLPSITVQKGANGTKEQSRIAECNQVKYYGSIATSLFHVLAVDLNELGKMQTEVVMGNIDNLYMSRNNLYLAATAYPTSAQVNTCGIVIDILGYCERQIVEDSAWANQPNTEILRYKLENKGFSYAAAGSVPGTVINQFAMDENAGYLRIATTQSNLRGATSTDNSLYVLDENLALVGKVENLAKGERIYAVRYLGERAYIVTFRQVDPLFVLDLSNPKEPEVLGELKIPGYSSYLHPYSENVIIGVGREADSTGRVRGLKAALFDVTDPANPKLIESQVIGKDFNVYSEILDNHKAFFFDRERNLMIIPVTSYDYASKVATTREYFQVFEVKANSLKLLNELPFDYVNQSGVQTKRVVRIGEKLFAVAYDQLRSYSLPDFVQLSKAELDQ